MSRHLPEHPNLDHLKKQAKALLGDLERRNPGAKLADALHAVAREYGFATWPQLKSHVESLIPENPFVGRWTADVSKSKRHPANQFQRATLEFAVVGDTVTITDVVVTASGQEERGTNTILADGGEHPSSNGYVLMARWLGSHALEAITKKDGHHVGHVRYAVSADRTTLTLSAVSSAYDGYPAAEQVSVFDRS
jgi:Glyoxalase superfamily protein